MNEFPDATIFRIAPFVSYADNLTENFNRETSFWYNLLPVYSDLKAKKQAVCDLDIAQGVLNAIKIRESAGKTYELGGPNVYTMVELLELFQNVLEFPFRAIKIPDNIYLSIAKVFRNKFINRERMIKERIDMVVSDNALTFKDLMIEPASIVPRVKEILYPHKRTPISNREENA